MGISNAALVQVALIQEGNVSGGPYWNWYGFDSCMEAGVASEGVPWFQQREQFQDASYTLAPGDIIFFDWESDGLSDHVGIIVNVENGTVNTIEDNSSDECCRKSYPIGSAVIYGYGIPAY